MLDWLLPRGSSRRKLAAMARNFAWKANPLNIKEKAFECPAHLRAGWRSLPDENRTELIEALKEHFFSSPECSITSVDEYISTDDGRKDLEAHINTRLDTNRKIIIPWLDEALSLSGAKILEIGCGTGSSTVALAEQGAEVIGIDIHGGALRVAEIRCRAHGLTARFASVSAIEAIRLFKSERFDFIIFFASLEHMTLEERLESLRCAWESLPHRGHLVVIECPNRLWYFDDHTSFTPFFHWLPDDLAFLYSRMTPRERFNSLFRGPTEESKLMFSRWGRGVSFHEFEIAFGCCVEDLPIVSCLSLFIREKTYSLNLCTGTTKRKFEMLLHDIYPKAHQGFYLPYLNLIFKKT